jgi:hypothetical protein
MGSGRLGNFLSTRKASKYVLTLVVLAHESNMEPEAPTQSRKTKSSDLTNQTIRFCRFSTAVRGAVGTPRAGILLQPNDVWTNDWQNYDNPRGYVGGYMT